MITFFKTILAILSMISVVFAPFFGNFAADYEPKNENCELNFAVLSDIHMSEETARRDMLEMALYDMDKSEATLDAIVLSGDMTDNGRRAEYENLADAFSKYTPADNIIMAVGNHDTWNDDVAAEFEFIESEKLFIEYNKKIANRDIDKVYYSTQVNGYTFIVMSSEESHTYAYISEEQIAWLDDELAKATADGKPVFVVSHWPINETHGLPLSWLDNPLFEDQSELETDDGGFGDESDKIEEVLQKYKNVILISGHLHNGIAKNSMYGYCSVENYDNVTSVNLPCFMFTNTKGLISMGTGFVFEVYEDEVLVRSRCFTGGIWYTTITYEIPIK